jgi:hypothetical protein
LQYVRLAKENDVGHKATLFNEKTIRGACADDLKDTTLGGEYWQYIGSGEWNRLVLAEKAGNVQIQAYAAYVTRQPLAQNPGAINVGELAAIGKRSGPNIFATYEKDGVSCELQISLRANRELSPQTVDTNDTPDCAMGGYNVSLGGTYYKVARQALPPIQAVRYPSKPSKPSPFAPIAGDYIQLQKQGAQWIIQQPCDATTVTLFVDAINRKAYFNWGMETQELMLEDIAPLSKGQSGFRVKASTDLSNGEVNWHSVAPDTFEVESKALQFDRTRFVAHTRLGEFPTVMDASCE